MSTTINSSKPSKSRKSRKYRESTIRNLLRKGPMTINDLAISAGITTNYAGILLKSMRKKYQVRILPQKLNGVDGKQNVFLYAIDESYLKKSSHAGRHVKEAKEPKQTTKIQFVEPEKLRFDIGMEPIKAAPKPGIITRIGTWLFGERQA